LEISQEDFVEKHKTDNDTRNIQWFAFYSDCLHEVKQVTADNRVTITYSIHKDLSVDYTESSKTREEEALRAIRNKIESIQTRPFGIFLKHSYTCDGVESGILQGDDKRLYRSLLTIDNLKLELLPVMYHQYKGWFHEDGLQDGNILKDVYSMTTPDMIRLMNKQPPLKSRYNEQVPFVIINSAGFQVSLDKHEEYNAGNYSEPNEFSAYYLHAAIIVSEKKRTPVFDNTHALSFHDVDVFAL
jgi:hypothetical protein